MTQESHVEPAHSKDAEPVAQPHTPGPWRLRKAFGKNWFIEAGVPEFSERTITIVTTTETVREETPRGTLSYEREIKTADADARLIAASPTLLSALKPLSDLFDKISPKAKDDDCWCGQDGVVIRYRDIRAARAAYDLATGARP